MNTEKQTKWQWVGIVITAIVQVLTQLGII